MIGNILSQRRNNPTKMPILLLALLQVPPKLSHESVHADEIQWQMYADALHAVFDLIQALLQEIAKDGAVIPVQMEKRAYVFQSYPPGLPTTPSIPY